MLLTKRNEGIHPFEQGGAASLEFLADKNECGLVVFGSSNKKRPNAVTLMRMFDGRLLDAVELLLLGSSGEEQQQQHHQHRGSVAPLPALGVDMKPMILFAGTVWTDSSDSEIARTYSTVKSLLLDIFSGEEVRAMAVEGLQYLLTVAAGEPENDGQATMPYIHLRWYKVRTKRNMSGGSQKLPRIELDNAGPRFDFKIGRIQDATGTDAMKHAMKQVKNQRSDGDFKSKSKNIGMDRMGDKIGHVHLTKQDLGQLQTRKVKGLKRGPGGFDDVDDHTGGVEGGEEEMGELHDEEDEAGGVELYNDDVMDVDDDEVDVIEDVTKRPRLV